MAGKLAASCVAADAEFLVCGRGALSQEVRSVWENCSCSGDENIGQTSHSGGSGHALGLKCNVVLSAGGWYSW